MDQRQQVDGDYVLGTHQDELTRLGLQHRIWRPAALDCWRRAGIGPGSRVLDVGAGPGFATCDLAEIVGPEGHVLALERSKRFVEAGRHRCAERKLNNVQIRCCDVIEDPIDEGGFDAAWVRWVACFVSSPQRLVERLAAALRPGGVVVFHEYWDYGAWSIAPDPDWLRSFVKEVMLSWRADGGEPDVATQLPALLEQAGFQIRHIRPHAHCVRPCDPLWQWPAGFIEINLGRLLDLGRVSPAWVERVRSGLRAAEQRSCSVMSTPMVLEIIANREQ